MNKLNERLNQSLQNISSAAKEKTNSNYLEIDFKD